MTPKGCNCERRSKRLAHRKDGAGLAAVKGNANLVGVVIAIAVTAIGIAMMAELGVPDEL